MTTEQMASSFNEWMRRFTQEPDRYQREFETVSYFLQQLNGGFVPTYGAWCAGYLETISRELFPDLATKEA